MIDVSTFFNKVFKPGILYDTLLLTFVKIITILAGLLTTKILSAHFSLLDYGTYSQTTLIVSICTSFSILGLTDASNYFYNKSTKTEEKSRFMNAIFSIQYFAGILCAVFIMMANDTFTGYFNNNNLVPLYKYIAFSPLLSNLIPMLQVIYLSIGKARVIAFRNLTVSILKVIIVYIAAFVTSNIETILALSLILDFSQVVYFYYGLRNNIHLFDFKKVHFRYIKKILQYSLPMSVSILLNYFLRDVDKLMIGHMSDTATLAIYTNASKVLPFDVLTTSFTVVLLPILTRYVQERQYIKTQMILKNYLNFSFITTFIFTTGAILCAKELLAFLYDVKYLAGINVFIIYILVDLIRFANVSVILCACGKTNYLLYVSLAALMGNVICNLIFFKIIGLCGPAIATLLFLTLSNITIIMLCKKDVGSNVFLLFNIKAIIRLVITAGITFLSCLAVKNFLNYIQLSNTLVLLSIYTAYVAVLVKLNYSTLIFYCRSINKMKGNIS